MEALYMFSTDPNFTDNAAGCDGTLERPSCQLTAAQLGIWDVVAAMRMLMSCLSILGSSSIIATVIRKREVTNPKIHPIFALSLADLLLAVMWVVGGGLWLHKAPDRSWCFAVSLLTVILVCVSVNLTVVYALLMYSTLRNIDVLGILSNRDVRQGQGWRPIKTALAYVTALFLPVVLVLVLFGAVAGRSKVVARAGKCSCWCAPLLGNVLPYAIHREQGTADFVYGVRQVVAMYGGIEATHFLLGFLILVVVYYKILKLIRDAKSDYERGHVGVAQSSRPRGQKWNLISQEETKARRRVFYFLAVFAITGFFNCILSFGSMVYELHALSHGRSPEIKSDFNSYTFEPFYVTFATLQSLTITQQGFLNAIVYGWTRDNFINTVTISALSEHENKSFLSSVATVTPDLDEDTWIIESNEEEEVEVDGEGEGKPSSASLRMGLSVSTHLTTPN